MNDEQKIMLTQEELAYRWAISTATLERDRSLKKGCKYLKIGGAIRYRFEDILQYENECTHEPRSKRKYAGKPLDSEAILSTARASMTRIYQDEWVARDQDVLDFARAIERAHGIGDRK